VAVDHAEEEQLEQQAGDAAGTEPLGQPVGEGDLAPRRHHACSLDRDRGSPSRVTRPRAASCQTIGGGAAPIHRPHRDRSESDQLADLVRRLLEGSLRVLPRAMFS
jgi:hypothetical protein